MDALVAYLQMLGTLVDFSTYDAAGPTHVEETDLGLRHPAHLRRSWPAADVILFFIGAVPSRLPGTGSA